METGKIEAGKILFKALLKKDRFSEAETIMRFEQACSQDYWRELNPQLNVCENLSFDNFERVPFNQQAIGEMQSSLDRGGYFCTSEPLITDKITSAMLLAVQNLRKAGWHEAWAFVYDEFWQVVRTPSMLKLLSGHLGEKYMALPHVVVHYVHPETGTGWSPHVDFSDRQDRFTVWFSLSDATLDNGCMYIITRNKVSPALLDKWLAMEDLGHKEVKTLLQNSKALPVQAGSLLGWKGDVVHWGSTSTKNTQPRVSLSVVFIKENTSPMTDEVPLLLPTDIPDFPTRMISIANSIKYYNVHVLALNKFDEIAKRLLETFKDHIVI
jgi:hypothetical protein